MLHKALAALALALAVVSPTSAQLDKWAKAAGLKYFGTAVDNPSLGNAAYMKIARDTDEFGAVTPANGQKWSNTETGQGSFSYGSGDAVANVAKQTKQLLRCHTLVWYSQLPGWGMSPWSYGVPISPRLLSFLRKLYADTRSCCSVSGSWDKNTMQRVITTHIQNVVGHYKGQCYAWDVVNEALEDDGKYRQSPSRFPVVSKIQFRLS